jgi:hypothetical protein
MLEPHESVTPIIGRLSYHHNVHDDKGKPLHVGAVNRTFPTNTSALESTDA